MTGQKFFYNSPFRYYWNDDTGNISLADEQFFYTSSPLSISVYGESVDKFNSTSLDSTILFNISGSSLESYNNTTYIGSGSLSLLNSKAESRTYNYTTVGDTALFGVSGTSVEKFVSRIPEQTPNISIVNVNVDEKVTFDYNEDTVLKLDLSDFGSISVLLGNRFDDITLTFDDTNTLIIPFAGPDQGDDYGIISDLITNGYEDYGSTEFGAETKSATGLISISGFSGDLTGQFGGNAVYNYVGIGLFAYFDFLVERTSYNFVSDETVNLEIFGTLIEKSTNDYVANGSLFSFGEKVESVTYDYNESSILAYDQEDYQSVSTPATIFDSYGNILDFATAGQEDFSFIVENEEAVPYGSIVISGESINDQDAAFIDFIPSGLASISGTAIEKFVANTPEDIQIIDISGSATYSETDDYVANGSLFSFGEKIESRTYDYNDESILAYETEDYQNISSTATVFDTYGQITEITTSGQEDFSFIVELVEAVPYGSIVISGESINDEDASFIDFIPSGTITISSFAIEKFVANDFEQTQLLSIQGSTTYSETDVYVANGSLFSFGEKVESRTYDYNDESISTYIVEDSGFVSDPVTSSEDNGFITNVLTQGESDSGFIVLEQTTSPFGTIVISGTATGNAEFNVYGTDEISSGLATISGSAVEKFITSYDLIPELLDISGSATYSETDDYVANGSLFSFGEKVESVTYDYTDESIETFDVINYGNISDISTDSDDYGSVGELGFGSGQFDFGYVISQTEVKPYGTISLSGQSAFNATTRETFTGLFTISSFSSYKQTSVPTLSGLFEFSGRGITGYFEQGVPTYAGSYGIGFQLNGFGSESFTKGLYTGIGSLFSIGYITERVTYSYNRSSVSIYEIDDFGNFGAVTSSVDYGVLTEFTTQGQDDFGIVVFGETADAFGSITLSSQATTNYIINDAIGGTIFAFSGSSESYTASPESPQNGIIVSGASIEKSTNDYVANGSLFSFGEKVESRTYDYNNESVTVFGVDDNGSITNPVTSTSDYGSIVDFATQGQEDLGSLVFEQTVVPFGGITLSGSSTDFEFNAFIDFVPSGTITLSDKLTERRTYYPQVFQRRPVVSFDSTNTTFDSTELDESTLDANTTYLESTIITGNKLESFSKGLYSGSGSLFSFGEKLESVTYDYNNESVTVFGSDDNGSIANPVTSISDYGSIVDFATQGQEDLGLLVFEQTVVPFGGITLSGSSIDSEFNAFIDFIPSGIINISIDHIERRTYDWFSDSSSTNINVNGTANESFTPATEIGSGSLFSFGEKVESRTYDYNNDSVTVFNSEDNGLITSSPTSSSNYGSIVDFATQGQEDLGSLVFDQTIIPFGTISISGGASDIVEFNVYGVEFITSGTITISGELVHPNVDFTPVVTASGDITITGSADESFAITTYIGSGSLFSFGEKIESRTYDYNNESVTVFGIDDNGSIIDLTTSASDYGSIVEIATQGQEDLGSLVFDQTIIPFGTITISGGVSDIQIAEGTYSGSGTITVSGELVHPDIDFTPAPDGFGIINITGFCNESFTPAVEIGSGSLFSFGEKIESRTYDYNDETILPLLPPDDNGSIVDPVTSTSDYGGILDLLTQGEQDYGLIATEQTILPFGTITISGGVSDIQIVEGTYAGSGTITISGELVYPELDFTPAPDGSGTINITGNLDESYSRTSYIGSGSLFSFGDKAESRTYDYNEESVLSYTEPDYGSILDVPTQLDDDYETIAIAANRSDDYGVLVGFGVTTEVPFGKITISGELVYPELDFTPAPDGSGTLNISGSADPSVVFIFGRGRRRGGNIRLDGLGTAAKTVEVDSYVGKGTLFKFGIAPESYTVVPETVGIGVISGTALESFSAQTPEDTQLFVIDGSSLESRQREYTGFGTLPSLYGELFHPDIDYTPHYGIEENIGIGTTGIQISGESRTVRSRAKSGTGLFEIYNNLPFESFTPATEIGVGTIRIDITSRNYSPIYPLNSGDPGAGTGLIRINDDAGLSITRATLPYFAKGGFIVTGTSGESFSYTNYNGSGIITISGSAPNREINVYGYYGDDRDPGTSGTITISAQTLGIVEKNTESYVGSGGLILSDRSIYREIDAYNGSGQISVSGNANESFVANPDEGTILFNIFGSGFESVIYQPTEDTVLYNIIGAASDERILKDYVGIASTSTLLVSGNAIVSLVPSIPGTGLFRFVRYASDDTNLTCDSDVITSDYADNAEESVTWNTPEETIIVGISGISPTAEINTYIYNGFISVSITEDKSEKYAKDYDGSGTLFSYGTRETENISYEYSGDGNLFADSKSSDNISYLPENNTVTINIDGYAFTSAQATYQYNGSTDIQISQSSDTSTDALFEYEGLSSFEISGETLYPDIIFIPSWIGSGSINIFGSSDYKQVYGPYIGIGSLFTISGAKESFSESSYDGSGELAFSATSSEYINNPYQIPRTYVCII